MDRSTKGEGFLYSLLFALLAVLPTISYSEPDGNLSQSAVCVEASAEIADVSRKRRATISDCDPKLAFAKAQSKSRVNARDKIAPICLEKISDEEAISICQSRGLVVTDSPDPNSQIGVAGKVAPNFNLPIHSENPELCAILRDVPSETETSTRSAGIENGFCIFNGNKLTTKVVRSRSTCGVYCRTF